MPQQIGRDAVSDTEDVPWSEFLCSETALDTTRLGEIGFKLQKPRTVHFFGERRFISICTLKDNKMDLIVHWPRKGIGYGCNYCCSRAVCESGDARAQLPFLHGKRGISVTKKYYVATILTLCRFFINREHRGIEMSMRRWSVLNEWCTHNCCKRFSAIFHSFLH